MLASAPDAKTPRSLMGDGAFYWLAMRKIQFVAKVPIASAFCWPLFTAATLPR